MAGPAEGGQEGWAAGWRLGAWLGAVVPAARHTREGHAYRLSHIAFLNRRFLNTCRSLRNPNMKTTEIFWPNLKKQFSKADT